MTNADATTADEWLSHHKWNLSDAVNAYMETTMSGAIKDELLEAIFDKYRGELSDFL